MKYLRGSSDVVGTTVVMTLASDVVVASGTYTMIVAFSTGVLKNTTSHT